MNNTVTASANKTFSVDVNDVNIETKLFANNAGEFCVRIRDLDADENVTIVKFKAFSLAEAYFTNAVRSAHV